MKKWLICSLVVLLLSGFPGFALAASDDTQLTVRVDDQTPVYYSQSATFITALPYGPPDVELYVRTQDRDAVITKVDGQKLAEPLRTYRHTYTVTQEPENVVSVKLTVRAADDSEKTYTIKMVRPAGLKLEKLLLSRTPTGASAYDAVVVDEGVYAATVSAGETVLYIRPQATAMGAKISLKPLDYGEKLEEVAEGVYLFPIANQLQQGECRTFRITLGIGDYPRRTVDVAITRGVSGSDDATLAGVKFLSSYRQDQSNTALMISPAFSADVLNYKLYLPADVANFTVWPDPAAREDQVTVTVNGAAWLGGNSYKDLPGRTKTVEIAVTAENLQDRRTYTFQVIRPTMPQNGADLARLSLRATVGGSADLGLSPAFGAGCFAYSGVVSTSQSRVYLYPELAQKSAAALVFVNGELLTGSYREIALQNGANTLCVQVLSADYLNLQTYTITLYRGGGSGGLSGLSLRTVQGEAVNYSPLFRTDHQSYVANVFSRSTGLYFAPIAASPGSVLTLTQGNGQVYQLSAGTWSRGFDLTEGSNHFTLAVTPAGGGTTSYDFSVYRRPATVNCQVSNQALSVNGQSVLCAAYNINGNNFFKLRDVAALLTQTTAKVGVSYNGDSREIHLLTGVSYVPVGGELNPPGLYHSINTGNQQVYVDGEPIFPMAYNIDGNNYFLLRDLGALLGFTLDYDQDARTIAITVPE